MLVVPRCVSLRAIWSASNGCARAPTLWIAESDASRGPASSSSGYSLDGTQTQALYVSQEGIEEGGKRAIRYRR